MPIRIGDECPERIEPLKATGIFVRQTSGVSQENSRSSPWVRGIVLNRRQAQYGDTAPDADAIESVALEEIVRIGVDHARLSRGEATRRHHVQRERFEHEEIAPASGDGITGTATGGELDEHVTSVNEGPELRTFTARGRSRRMSRDRGLGHSGVVGTRRDRNVERLPSSKRLISNDEIAGKVFSAPRHRQQSVMIGPIDQARRQPQIRVSRREVVSEESGWTRVRDLYRKAV